jgi:hypothetical protein
MITSVAMRSIANIVRRPMRFIREPHIRTPRPQGRFPRTDFPQHPGSQTLSPTCLLVRTTLDPAGVPASFLADNLLDLDAAQGLDAVSYQMQELLPLYAFHLTPFHIDENESRHLVGDFKLRFAGNLDIDSFSHFAPR